MLVGLTLKVSNGLLYQYRQEHATNDKPMTQGMAAQLAGVNIASWNAVENMRFHQVSLDAVRDVAELLGVNVERIYPEEMRGADSRISKTILRELEGLQLYAAIQSRRLTADDPTSGSFDEHDKQVVKKQIDSMLMTLSYREREIIKLRFGFGDSHTYTYEEIGRIFKVTRERVRMVEAKAIRKLQHPIRVAKLLPNHVRSKP